MLPLALLLHRVPALAAVLLPVLLWQPKLGHSKDVLVVFNWGLPAV